MELNQQVEQIEEKIKQLLLQYSVLQEENQLLKNQLTEQQKVITELTNKLDEPQRGGSNNGEEGKSQSVALQNQIDHFIQEIDKCIEWLQNA